MCQGAMGPVDRPPWKRHRRLPDSTFTPAGASLVGFARRRLGAALAVVAKPIPCQAKGSQLEAVREDLRQGIPP
jgi:hypothetical protein